MDPKKKLLDQGKRDVTKAGRMFLDAVFGDTGELLRKLGEEGDDPCDESEALTVEGHEVPQNPQKLGGPR